METELCNCPVCNNDTFECTIDEEGNEIWTCTVCGEEWFSNDSED